MTGECEYCYSGEQQEQYLLPTGGELPKQGFCNYG